MRVIIGISKYTFFMNANIVTQNKLKESLTEPYLAVTAFAVSRYDMVVADYVLGVQKFLKCQTADVSF